MVRRPRSRLERAEHASQRSGEVLLRAVGVKGAGGVLKQDLREDDSARGDRPLFDETRFKLLEQRSNTYGFDAQTEQYVDLVEAGIVDPTKVVRIALQDAASVAALLITTEALVADRPKKDTPAPMPGGGGMGDMDF